MADKEEGSELENLIDRYTDEFKQSFPVMLVQDMDGATMKDIITRCLESGKPYEPDFDEDVVY